MAAEMENKPIGEALDQLAKAEKNLDRAGGSLRADAMPEAQNRERSALADLVAARKMFQKAVSDNPKAFDEPKPDEPPPPVAEDTKKLREMAEFRNEAKAAQDFVQQTANKQKDIARQAQTATRNTQDALATEEKILKSTLEEFQKQHPQAFKDAREKSAEAQQAMQKAAQSLDKKTPEAKKDTQQAAEQLAQLSQAMKEKSADQQLADAYKLKQMLDKQIQSYGQCQNSPAGFSSGQLQQAAGETRETLKQLKQMAEIIQEMVGDGGYTYLDFYMGTSMASGRADLIPVYTMIFRRMYARGMDWIYHFPRLYAVDLRPLKKQLDEQQKGDEPEWESYDPSAAFEEGQEETKKDEEIAELRSKLDEGHQAAVEAARDLPPPATVRAYEAVYGAFPDGWPPEV